MHFSSHSNDMYLNLYRELSIVKVCLSEALVVSELYEHVGNTGAEFIAFGTCEKVTDCLLLL